MRFLTSIISVFKRLAAIVTRRKIERDVDDELAFHLAMKEASGKGRVSDPALAARRQFGNVTLYQEQTREMWTFPSLESISQDVRYALRGLRRAPGFSVVAILALALGIGANTAIYSLVQSVFVNGLPFRDSSRLVLLIGNVERETVERRGNSYPDHADWRAQTKSFEDMAAFSYLTSTLRSSGEPERLSAESVSPSYFSILGITPQAGRVFREDENAVENRDAVVILSDALWRRSFGADPKILNTTITLGTRAFQVVGVMPAGFTGLTDMAQLWVPFAMGGNAMAARGSRGFSSVARLKPGVTLAAAQAEMKTISAALAKAYPDTNDKRSVEVSPLATEIFSGLRAPLASLMAAVVFVLLIACANVANLMVTRADVRAREIALRTALGAGRARLLRQLVTEGVVLAFTGALVGLAFAFGALRALIATSPVTLPSFSHPSIDIPVLLFTAGLAMATGVLLGLAPAIHSRIGALNDALKASARGSSRGGSQRLRGGLVVVEVALTVVLSVGAGLMIRTAQNLSAIAPGFRTDNVLTMNLAVPRQPAPPAAAPAATSPPAPGTPAPPPPPFVVDWRTLMDRVAAVPGVSSVAMSSDAPLTGASSAVFYAAEGDSTSGANRAPRAYIHRVSPGFFSTLDIPFRDGRTFTDGELSPSSSAVIVSEAVAKRFWPGQSALGRRIKIGNAASQNPWLAIVGVVPELKYRALPNNPTADPDLYMPILDRAQQSLVIRTAQAPSAVSPGVRAALRETSRAIVPFAESPLDQLVQAQTATSRFTTWVLGFFAAAALLLAMIGLYGVVSYLVDQREKEFGIRLALGAARSSIVGLVFRDAGTMVAIGLAIGSVAAWQMSRLIEAQLFGVKASDSSSVIAVGTLAFVALAACVVPAIRATRVAPVTALRNE
jgi:putative ABC transport system permease protein